MIWVILMLLGTPALEREYLTDRPDALGAFMRCASKALNDDVSIAQREALDRIGVDCRPFRDEAVRIFVPIYQERMKLSAPITDVNDGEQTIVGVVLAEQMRREAEGMKVE